MIDVENLKTKLASELAQVTADLSAIATLEPETGDWVAIPESSLSETDENSEADAFEDSEERQATLASLETTYRNVIRALDKIASGSFGTCEICNQEIEEDRLSFLPTARTCKEHLADERALSL